MSTRTFCAAATLLLLVAIACRKEAPAPTLTVTPAAADIAPGSGPFTFAATQTNSSAAVSWSIVPGSCASPGSVDTTSGVYTPPVTNDVACTLLVRATAGTLTADATVNLSALSASGDTLTITPTSGSVTAGNPAPFTFYVDSSDTVTTPTCALSPSLGTCIEASNPGTHTHAFEVTAPFGLVKTATAVEATVTVGTLSGLVAVTVRPSVLVVSGPATVTAGGGAATYSVSAPDITGETVTWSVQPAVGSISAAGVYTPPATQDQSTTFDVVATIGAARGTLSVQLQPLPTGTAAAGLLAMYSALEAKALECLGFDFGAYEWNEMNAVAASVQSAVDAGRLAYDPSAQATCLASIAATTCLQMLHYVDPGECLVSAFSGRVAQGGHCSESVECADGYCGYPEGTCPGTCAPRAQLNGACTDNDQCAAGLVCSNFQCSAVTVVADGATCDGAALICAATSDCKWGFPSKCVPLGSAGSPCFAASDCIASLTCNEATTTCTQYAARNEPCGSTAGCNRYTDYCTQGGICGALPALGESCAYSGRCTWDYWCDTSLAVPTCVAYPTVGQPCTGTSYCQGQAYCDRSLAVATCVAYPTVGQPCVRVGSCAGEAYCNYALATPTCVAKKTSGTCTSTAQCANGYYCDGNFATPGNCQPQGAAGAACSGWDQCQSQLDCIGGICSVTSCY